MGLSWIRSLLHSYHNSCMKQYILLIVSVCILCIVWSHTFAQWGESIPSLPPIDSIPLDPIESDGTSQPAQSADDCSHCQANQVDCLCKCRGWIVLNTDIPFVGRCIQKDGSADVKVGEAQQVNSGNAFARLMSGLMRIVLAAVVIVWFIGILIWGLMIASHGASGKMSEGKDLIVKIVAGLALVWLSGMILNLINPNFFKTSTEGSTPQAAQTAPDTDTK